MDKALLRLLREVERKGRANDERESDRARKMLNLEPGTAQLASILLRSSGARHVLEIGTSNGYSTIWLAWSLVENIAARAREAAAPPPRAPAKISIPRASADPNQDTGDARIISIDRSPDKHALARENLRRAGFDTRVDLRTGDATAIIGELRGPFDFVFFDGDRVSAPAQLQLLLPRLAAKVLLLHDNALSHPGEIASYLALVESLPEFQHTVVPVGKGLSVAYRA
jgi:predicted O-methyltransferase YrrM